MIIMMIYSHVFPTCRLIGVKFEIAKALSCFLLMCVQGHVHVKEP